MGISVFLGVQQNVNNCSLKEVVLTLTLWLFKISLNYILSPIFYFLNEYILHLCSKQNHKYNLKSCFKDRMRAERREGSSCTQLEEGK